MGWTLEWVCRNQKDWQQLKPHANGKLGEVSCVRVLHPFEIALVHTTCHTSHVVTLKNNVSVNPDLLQFFWISLYWIRFHLVLLHSINYWFPNSEIYLHSDWWLNEEKDFMMKLSSREMNDLEDEITLIFCPAECWTRSWKRRRILSRSSLPEPALAHHIWLTRSIVMADIWRILLMTEKQPPEFEKGKQQIENLE